MQQLPSRRDGSAILSQRKHEPLETVGSDLRDVFEPAFRTVQSEVLRPRIPYSCGLQRRRFLPRSTFARPSKKELKQQPKM